MTYAITKKELLPQPTLVLRRRVKRAEIATTLAQSFGTIFQYAQRTGSVLAGQPFTRFLEWGPAATTAHLGPYQGLAEAHATIRLRKLLDSLW